VGNNNYASKLEDYRKPGSYICFFGLPVVHIFLGRGLDNFRVALHPEKKMMS